MKRMGNTGREMVQTGAWVKVGRKHYAHISGVEVVYRCNDWAWEVIGTGLMYQALWVAKQAAEKAGLAMMPAVGMVA